MAAKSIARLKRGKKGFLDEIFGIGLIAELSERVMIEIITVLIDPIDRLGNWRWSEARDHLLPGAYACEMPALTGKLFLS